MRGTKHPWTQLSECVPRTHSHHMLPHYPPNKLLSVCLSLSVRIQTDYSQLKRKKVSSFPPFDPHHQKMVAMGMAVRA